VKLITAPTREQITTTRSIFLAGGISGCGNWQNDMIKEFNDSTFTVVNPRRAGTIDRKDMVVSEEQIKWEFDYIRETSDVMFWFPSSSVCPIALYELGATLERMFWFVSKGGGMGRPQKVYIGCDPAYDRLVDVKIQVKLIETKLNGFIKLKINESLKDVLTEIKQHRFNSWELA
jgi:hypothetical protein